MDISDKEWADANKAADHVVFAAEAARAAVERLAREPSLETLQLVIGWVRSGDINWAEVRSQLGQARVAVENELAWQLFDHERRIELFRVSIRRLK